MAHSIAAMILLCVSTTMAVTCRVSVWKALREMECTTCPLSRVEKHLLSRRSFKY